jgi:hypothetical protein
MDMAAQFFTDCSLRKLHEFLLYLVTAIPVIALFFSGLLKIGSSYSGLRKQLIANAAAAIPVAVMIAELWLVDERSILPSTCPGARVDATSMIVWSAGLALALCANFLVFGKRLQRLGFYVGKKTTTAR